MKNLVILIGNLGKDPEVRNLENGNTVANFPLATSEHYKDKQGNRQEKTEWHNIILWGKVAEIAEKYLNKGDKVCIEGKLQSRSWEDKDGNTRYITEVVGRDLTMLGGSKSEDTRSAEIFPAKEEAEVTSGDEDSDLPF